MEWGTREQFYLDYSPQQREECQNGELKANQRDCATYFECVNGRFEIRLCPYGQNFDPTTRCCRSDYQCSTISPIYQSSNYEQISSNVNECNYGDRRADNSDCTKYFSCAGEEKRFVRRFCPQGEHFDERLNRCVPGICQNGLIFGEQDEDTPCQESSGRSGYRIDANNCRKFYQCAQGKWVHKDCPSNLVWNPTSLVCDWPQDGYQC
uniref:Chitin-binding type-2 domain-containing protein n=1 Tax=Ascaris lumbricoides TaxID=6252 RepID=A0A0M3ILL9_ASCLU